MEIAGRREFAGFRLETAEKELWYGSGRVALSPKEAEILCLLAEQPGRLVTKEEIVEAVWPNSFVEESNLSRQVYMLRKRLGELGAPRDLIENVPKRGYRFNARVLGEASATVIEKHFFTQTFLEEVVESSEFDTPEVLPLPTYSSRVLPVTLVVAASLILIASITLAAWRVGDSSARAVKTNSIAVLPFKVIGTGDESSGAAMADLIITRLSSLKDLKVRPTTAVMEFDFSVSSLEFGKRLGVDSVLEGTVVRSSEGDRVTARLMNISTGDTIWSDEFAAQGQAVLNLHDEIANEMLGAMSLEQAGAPSMPRQLMTSSQEALRHYTKARYQWNRRNTEGLQQAADLFRRANDADPNFVLAKIGLAETLMMGYQHEEASKLLNEAALADPSRGQVFAAKGFIDLFHRWEWDSAETNFKAAIERSPGHPSAYQWYAILLSIKGRPDEAKAKMQLALEIDPVSPNLIADLGQIYYFAGELDTAERLAKDSLAIEPNFTMAHFLLADIYFQRSETDLWVHQYITAQKSLGSSIGNKRSDGHADSVDGDPRIAVYRQGGLTALEEQLIQVDELDSDPNRFIFRAKIFARRGESARAIRNLKLALSSRAFLMPFVKSDPIFEKLRTDLGFQDLLRQMNL